MQPAPSSLTGAVFPHRMPSDATGFSRGCRTAEAFCTSEADEGRVGVEEWIIDFWPRLSDNGIMGRCCRPLNPRTWFHILRDEPNFVIATAQERLSAMRQLGFPQIPFPFPGRRLEDRYSVTLDRRPWG